MNIRDVPPPMPMPAKATTVVANKPQAAFDRLLHAPVVDLLELHVTHADGRGSILVTAWRLAATGRLEQDANAAAMHAAMPRDALAVAAPMQAMPAMREGAASLAPAMPMPRDASHMAAFALANAPTRGIADIDPDLPPAPHVIDRDSADPSHRWLARLCRWIESDRAGATAWVRDYRLGDADIAAIAEWMRTTAQEHGVALRRIVVNGRERWAAPAFASQQEHTACP